jgi:hypothetical protein
MPAAFSGANTGGVDSLKSLDLNPQKREALSAYIL